MKKIIGIFFLAVAVNMHAQEYVRPNGQTNNSQPNNTNPPPSQFGDNLSIGGSFGLQFGPYTFVGLEPVLSYHFNKSFMFGVGPIYQYLSVDQGYGTYTASSYGARVTALYFLPEDLSRIFIMGEYDVINVPEQNQNTGQLYRGNLALPMLGIGYKEPVPTSSSFAFTGCGISITILIIHFLIRLLMPDLI